MGKKERISFLSTLSINPYKNMYVSAISNSLNEIVNPTYNKEQYVISYLNTKSFINSSITISKNIPDEDLYDALYNKAYDEFGLDQAIIYQIQYIETFNALDEENRSFHIFIIDPTIIDDIFKSSIEKVKYIDYIVPSPLLLKSLYDKEILTQERVVDCFIYFQENDTFIAIYKDKNFIYSKSINYSLLQMHERFCEIYAQNIEYKEFINFLSNEDLKISNSPYKTAIIKLYKEIFANINDVLTYVKRALEIDKIDSIYIDTELSSITKLDEISEVELSIKSSSFNFNYGFKSDKSPHIDYIHYLMQIYTTVSTAQRYGCNFTAYHRPPKFTKRASGKIILFAAASLILAFIYPISYWALTHAQSLQYKLLEENYRVTHEIKITRETTLNIKKREKEKISELLAQEEQEYIDKRNTLIKIHDVKVNYPMKADLLHTLTKDLNNYSVQLEFASYSETDNNSSSKELHLGLVSSNDKKITDFIKYLTSTYEGKYHFFIDKIFYEDTEKLYFAQLKMSLL